MCGAISPLTKMCSRHGVEISRRRTFFTSFVVSLGVLTFNTSWLVVILINKKSATHTKAQLVSAAVVN
jgi:hypothetical protein